MSETSYNDFKKLYVDLIDGFQDKTGVIQAGTQSLNYDELSKTILDDYNADIKECWQHLISLMSERITQHIEEDKSRIGVKYGDFHFDDVESVIKYIAENIDINLYDKDIFEQVANEHPEWNDSINWLVEAYNTAVEKIKPDILPSFVDMSWRDFSKADAGLGYSDLNNLVKPLKNIDGNSYRKVRDELIENEDYNSIDEIPHDIMPSAALSDKESQYTCNQSNNENAFYTRLIMPKYDRRLELEDLNRNFWVIAQTLSGLCDILFPEEPLFFKDVLEGILNELPQLWENILYLWTQMGVISQKELITNIQTLFIPIYNNEIENYIKFDYFEIPDRNINNVNCDELLDIAINNFSSLTSDYKNINLFIVPEFRLINKQHNYYSAAIYPGAIFYNVNNGTWIKMSAQESDKCFINLTNKEDEIAQYLMGTKIANHKYTFVNNYINIPVGYQGLFYGLCRSQLDSNISFSEAGIQINKFDIKFIDVSYDLKNNNHKEIGKMSFSAATPITENVDDLTVVKTHESSESYFEPNTVPITKGWYGGELLMGLPQLNLTGSMEVIVFSYNQKGKQEYRATWTKYQNNYNDPESDLNKNWYNPDYPDEQQQEKPGIVQEELSLLSAGECKFLLRRVLCVDNDDIDNSTPQNVFELCDAFCLIYKDQAERGYIKSYNIKADYSNVASDKPWPEGFDKVMVSAVQGDPIGQYSTVYLGRLMGNVAVNSDYPVFPSAGHVSGKLRYNTSQSVDESKGHIYPFTAEDNSSYWRGAYPNNNMTAQNYAPDVIDYRKNFYGSLIREPEFANLYQSAYEISERAKSDTNWIADPPANLTEQNDEITTHSSVFDMPFSTTGTFITSPGSVDTSGGTWFLNPFKIVVIDRAYLYSSNAEDKVAYYYNCSVRREDGQDYIYAEFNCFKNQNGTQRTKEKYNSSVYNEIVGSEEGEKWINGETYNVIENGETTEIQDKLIKLTLKYSDIADVLE